MHGYRYVTEKLVLIMLNYSHMENTTSCKLYMLPFQECCSYNCSEPSPYETRL